MYRRPRPYQGRALPTELEGHMGGAGVEPAKAYASRFSSVLDGQLSVCQIGRRWGRTSEGLRQQIYSLPPLATRAAAQKPIVRFELTTYGLQNRCSTAELYRHNSLVF